MEQIQRLNAPLSDKWAHFLAFAGLTFLWLCIFRHPTRRQYIATVIFGVAFGVLIELLQLTLTFLGRGYELMDIVADAIGVGIGLVCFLIFRRIIQPSPSRRQQ